MVATVASNDAMESPPRQKIHHLSEQRLANLRGNVKTIMFCIVFAATMLFPVLSQAQRPDAAHSIQPIGSLKGIKAISVNVFVEGIREIPDSEYISEMQRQLARAGITILPTTLAPKTYPNLTLHVYHEFMRDNAERLAGSIVVYRLELEQLFPQKVGSQTMYVRGATWETTAGIAWGPSITIVSALRKGYKDKVAEFVEDYKKVN